MITHGRRPAHSLWFLFAVGLILAAAAAVPAQTQSAVAATATATAGSVHELFANDVKMIDIADGEPVTMSLRNGTWVVLVNSSQPGSLAFDRLPDRNEPFDITGDHLIPIPTAAGRPITMTFTPRRAARGAVFSVLVLSALRMTTESANRSITGQVTGADGVQITAAPAGSATIVAGITSQYPDEIAIAISAQQPFFALYGDDEWALQTADVPEASEGTYRLQLTVPRPESGVVPIVLSNAKREDRLITAEVRVTRPASATARTTTTPSTARTTARPAATGTTGGSTSGAAAPAVSTRHTQVFSGRSVSGSTTGSRTSVDYSYVGRSGEEIRIDMTSSAFDTFLTLTSPSGRRWTDDDGGTDTNSRLVVQLPENGEYILNAGRYSGESDTGPFQLTLTVTRAATGSATAPSGTTGSTAAAATTAAPSGSSTNDATLRFGGTVSGTLTTSRTEVPYQFAGTSGQRVQFDLTSAAFDTYLTVTGPNNRRWTDDDGGSGTNSRLVLTLPSAGTYTVIAGRYSGTGAYQLAARAPTASSSNTTARSNTSSEDQILENAFWSGLGFGLLGALTGGLAAADSGDDPGGGVLIGSLVGFTLGFVLAFPLE